MSEGQGEELRLGFTFEVFFKLAVRADEDEGAEKDIGS